MFVESCMSEDERSMLLGNKNKDIMIPAKRDSDERSMLLPTNKKEAIVIPAKRGPNDIGNDHIIMPGGCIGCLYFVGCALIVYVLSMTSNLKEQCDALQDHNKDLEEKMDSLKLYTQVESQLNALEEHNKALEAEIAALQSAQNASVKQYGELEAHNNALEAEIVTLHDASMKEYGKLEARQNDLEEAGIGEVQHSSLDGATSGICTGMSTCDDWGQYHDKGAIFIDVDTSKCAFPDGSVPKYFTALTGDRGGYWATTGATSLYAAEHDSFRIYVHDTYLSTTSVSYAIDNKWRIQWLAVLE